MHEANKSPKTKVYGRMRLVSCACLVLISLRTRKRKESIMCVRKHRTSAVCVFGLCHLRMSLSIGGSIFEFEGFGGSAVDRSQAPQPGPFLTTLIDRLNSVLGLRPGFWGWVAMIAMQSVPPIRARRVCRCNVRNRTQPTQQPSPKREHGLIFWGRLSGLSSTFRRTKARRERTVGDGLRSALHACPLFPATARCLFGHLMAGARLLLRGRRRVLLAGRMIRRGLGLRREDPRLQSSRSGFRRIQGVHNWCSSSLALLVPVWRFRGTIWTPADFPKLARSRLTDSTPPTDVSPHRRSEPVGRTAQHRAWTPPRPRPPSPRPPPDRKSVV